MSEAQMVFNSKVEIWREKARKGELTQDEMREAIQLLRAIRENLPEPKASSEGSGSGPKGRKKKPSIDAEAILSDLGI